jgi:hypothetical protein
LCLRALIVVATVGRVHRAVRRKRGLHRALTGRDLRRQRPTATQWTAQHHRTVVG